jgi:hypothetical protein
MKYAIIYFVKPSDGGLYKDIQFRETYEEVQDFLKNMEFTNDIYYVLEVANDITQEVWSYMSDVLGKCASYEQNHNTN